METPNVLSSDGPEENLAPRQITGSHRRTLSSSGKPMSLTSLVLSFSSPPSQSRSYSSISRDGLSPELEKTPLFFGPIDSTAPAKASDLIAGELAESGSISTPSSADTAEVISTTKDIDGQVHGKSVSSYAANLVGSENESDNSKLHLDVNLVATPSEESSVQSIKQCHEECKPNQPICKDLEDFGTQEIAEKREASQHKPFPRKINEKCNGLIKELLTATDDNDVNDEEAEGLRAEEFTLKDFREKFAIAEALAKASMMTPPSVKRRLAARKIEMELDGGEWEANADNDGMDYVPPRQLLLYLVRMGSFNSAPKINNPDAQDDSMEVPQGLSTTGLMHYCKMMRGESRPTLLDRYFLKPSTSKGVISTDITDGLRVLKLDAVSKVCSAPVTSPNQIRILQWNILSQCLGQNNDGFVKCPEEALTWEHRKYLIVEEIVRNSPDIVCLQEVDHFKFLERVLGTQNYSGIFFPKPDSPCLYIQDNNGPDGCAIFYKREKFELVNFDTRILEVWRVQSNQVAIVANLRVRETGKEICICTTHLKARNGALLSKLRNEQGKDLLRFLNANGQGRPVILCGDFNAEPIEPIYSTVLNFRTLGLSSAYADLNSAERTGSTKKYNGNAISSGNEDGEESPEQELSAAEISARREPPYTTWKIREEGEVCHTIDYVFYSQKHLKVNNCLEFPNGHEIGADRTPSFQYPSDHFALVCDLEFRDEFVESKS